MGAATFGTRAVQLAAGTLAVLAALSACASDISRFDGPDGDRRFYEARCGLCHVPHLPSEFAPGEWPRLVDDMAGRAGLTRTQRERVLAYLQRAPR